MPRAADMLSYRTPQQFGAGQTIDRSVPMATPTGEYIAPPLSNQEKWSGGLNNANIANILYGTPTQDQLLTEFNQSESQAQPWYMKPMDMEGRATFLPFKDTLPGSVMNQRELALPGLLAGAVNAFTAPGRVSTQGFDAPEEAQNLAMNVMGGGISTGKMMRNPTGVGGTDLALNVWHGTPNEIKGGFDLAKIGTGEGNQAYGYGMYFGEARGTGETYRNNLSDFNWSVNGKPYDTNNAAHRAAIELKISGGNVNKDEIIKRYEKNIADLETRGADWANSSALQKRQELEFIKAGKLPNVEETSLGNLYKVDIPDEQIPMMLDWDKPVDKDLLAKITPENLGLQIKKFDDGLGYVTNEGVLVTRVKQGKAKEVTEEMLKNSFINSINRYSTSGQNLYGGLVPGNPKVTSEILSNAGIAGIRYLDEGSRAGTTKGTSNFVVFKPETVKILEKNDKPIDVFSILYK